MAKRIALVTGGTGGIGTAICQRLCQEGHQVIATYSSAAKKDVALQWQAEQKELGFVVEVVCMNVSSFESCAEAAELIRSEYGNVSILVNNAGITRDGVMKKMGHDKWDAVLSTNLDSVFYVTKQFLDQMIDANYGRIVNVSSINAQKGQFGQVNYSAAKAGIHGFTKALAQEVARKGITVNTISPGYVATSMVMAIDQSVRDQIIAQIPVGRLAEPAEIARAIAFLTAEEAGFMTGSNLAINGGQHMC
ncbi:MAG: acetoacetyl-CoA reductase [Hahellaceae bacterium]|jgi:acetoacetyl-CoA reductase|nr:acetoacetyl-CoA reductase [Hahellaceae bacterium]MCP5211930.1 acetoacetyl-CoA reductase [Hahellaceae bacterium]